MEYLEGETLATRLQKGRLPLDQALEYAAQIADALSKAHRQGIIHRDLKPGNVMLTKSGAKLLDFGLAKLRVPAASGIPSTFTTREKSITAEGTLLGTVPYMAPEQLEGKEADARSDLFSFGTVLYEMVSGKRAFEGESHASVIAAILEHDPPPLSSLQLVTPPALDRLVRRCLAKAPDARWESAHDVADELRWLRDAGPGAGTRVVTSRRGVGWPVALVTSLLVVTALSAGLLSRFCASPTVVNPSVSILPADNLTSLGVASPNNPTPGGSRTTFAWTPNGQALVFAGRRAGTAAGEAPRAARRTRGRRAHAT